VRRKFGMPKICSEEFTLIHHVAVGGDVTAETIAVSVHLPDTT